MAEALKRVVIVGAGQAGGWAAKTLRDEGFEGEIILVGDELHPPHERPPLSKDVLLGRATAASTQLFRADAFRQYELDFRPGCSVVALDRRRRTAELSEGGAIAFDRLILATGGRAARPSAPGATHALLLRTIEDAETLRERLLGARRAAVIGGGWIGLEIASVGRSLGLEVTVVEAAERLCSRAAHPLLSAYLLDLHRAHGVDVRLGVTVAGIDRSGVSFASGERLTADVVIAGVGMVANDQLAVGAGLAVRGGVLTDYCGRTADPTVFACGDVAVYRHPLVGRWLRLESWANAQSHAIACARALLGRPAMAPEVPWFWSDQFDVNMQLAGVLPPDAEIVARGAPQAGKGSWHAIVADRLVGVIAINAGRDVRTASRLIGRSAPVDRTAIRDPNFDLRRLLAETTA